MKKMTTTRFIAFWLCLCPLFCIAQDRHHDSLALVAFYNATGDTTWTNTWNLTEPMDTWYGITLDENGRVTCIDLDGVANCGGSYDTLGNNLSGNIPPEIGNLTNLEKLSLMNNQINGTIPPEIGNLTKLTELFLRKSQISGNIPPEIGNLGSLLVLQLEHNQLSNSIPPEIGNLDSLIYLSLAANELIDSIPPEIGNLSKLSELRLWGNQLTGDIPSQIWNLSNLTFLMLSANQLTGSIPPEVENLTNIHTLLLRYNQLTGSIPSEITNLEYLVDLSLDNNDFSGCYDDSLLNLCNQLSESSNARISDGNEFAMTWEDFCGTGESCTPCRQSDSLALVALYESTNGEHWINTWDLDEPMDTWYGISINLSGCVTCIDMDGVDNNCGDDYFDGGNNLQGNIPPEIGNLGSLEVLHLMNNQISGSIPSEIGNLNKLITLLLGGNQLSDSIPPEMGNMDNLKVMNLAFNKLSGSIPPEIGNLKNLSSLQLWGNQLTGNIPPQIGNLSNLWALILHGNQFTGSIPPEIENLTNLRRLYLHYNQLTGDIPPKILDLTHLEHLHLSHNQLTGNIPNFPDSTDLQTLLLDNNKFSFDAIEAIYSSISPNVDFQYSPQYHGEVQSHIVKLDTTLTLELSPPLSGNNNQNVSYQWKRNNDTLVTALDSIYLINDLQPSDVGKYTLHMTDTMRVPDLEVISEPIYVIVPGYDLYGQPVEYAQLILEFDNWQAKENFEADQDIRDAAAFEADDCSCNRLIYLWQFPDNGSALQTLIDINGKRQTQTSDGEVDGGFNNILGVGPISGTQGWTWIDEYPYSYLNSVTVFLLDSGTDTQNWNASDYLMDTAPVDSCYEILPHIGYDYTHPDSTIIGGFIDANGHGTFGMRAIAEGTDDYMNMKVVPLKIFDNDGKGTLFDFICALYHAIDHDADIIHVSAGYAGAPSDILEEAIAIAHSKGQFIVTSTGNDGVNIDSFPQYPAYYAKPFYKTAYNGTDSLVHYNNVISVAATNVMDTLWQHSNYGNETATIAAYGENMGGYSDTGEKVSYSGTSVSAYYVTRQLATEIARDKTRSLEDIWTDFDTLYLRDCPAISELTSTGKCLDIQLKEVYGDLRVFLEGAFDISGDTMRTDLNTYRHILPGQVDSILNDTLAIQPYGVSPFDYDGTESVPSTFDDYPPEVVDWVLISARTEVAADSTVSRTAAWLLKDGRIQLLKPLFEELTTAPDSVYIVVEHRNHIGIMSPQKLSVTRNIITWDFTIQDSYTTSTSVGQTMLDNLRWGMLAGDTNNDINGYDINGADKGFWQNDNGNYRLYLPTDFNLNGDINGEDKIFWERNNGKSSNVPRY